jgi:C4-dicarboxylate transporter DctM subunit
MGIVTVVSSAFFGAISGSCPAAVATIGKVMYPEMIKEKYGVRFTSGLITSAGNLAIIIPPSITMILYSSVTNASVGKLFIGGVIPGLILTALLSGYVVYYVKKNGIVTENKFSWHEVLEKSKSSVPTLLMPVVVLGGIYLGVFTPTEASIVSVFYALVVSFFFSKDFHLKDLWESLKSSAKLTTQIMVIMSSAAVFSQVLILGQVPQQIAHFINTYHITPTIFLIIVNIIFLIAGMFIDSASAIVALIPLLAPIVVAQGIDLVHFGLIVVINLAVGMFTPPFGLNLFTTMALFKVDIKLLTRGLIPFFFIFLVVLLLVTYIPSLSLWLPNLMYQGL